MAEQHIDNMSLVTMLYYAFGVKYPVIFGAHVMLDDLAGFINEGWQKLLALAPELSHLAPVIIDARRKRLENDWLEDVEVWEARMQEEIAVAFNVIEERLPNATHHDTLPSPLLTRDP